MNIPFYEYGDSGTPLHFLHANGYPPACYNPLLELLTTQYHVFGMLLRPLWPDSKLDELKDWHPLSEDLLQFLSTRKSKPAIGVGHSIGGIVTLRAALRDPQKFSLLVLLDPVLFPPYFILMWNVLRILGLGRLTHPMIPGALKRRREFDDLELVYRGYRTRLIFRYLSDADLRIYIKGITKPKADGGYTLAYTPEWESHIYYTGVWRDMDLWRGLKYLRVPTLIIRGAESNTFWEQSARLVRRKQPKIQVISLQKTTHLLPLERPTDVFNMMHAFVKETL